MDDVQQQLQAYWEEITSELPAPSVEVALQERAGEGMVRPFQQRHPTRRWPAWATAVVAFVAVLIIGTGTWLLRNAMNPH